MKLTRHVIYVVVAFSFITNCKALSTEMVLLELESNQQNTEFWVDGVKVAEGMFENVQITKSEKHTIKAKAPGYLAKTQRIRPQYQSPNVLSFYFTRGDKEKLDGPSLVRGALPQTTLHRGPSIPRYSENDTPLEQVDISGKYYALLIGNEDYSHYSKLKTPINDVDALASVLNSQFGFETQVLKNATRDQIMKWLYHYRTKLTKDEKFLVYFAGHGQLDRDTDEGYWLPVDADETTVNWIQSSVLSQEIKAFDSKHVLVISDSCYSGKLTRDVIRKGMNEKDLRDKETFLRKMLSNKSRMVMTSGGEEPVLDAGGKGNQHSIFADELINTLKGIDSMATSSQIYDRVQYRVTTNSDQTPEFSPIRKADHEGAMFVFVKK